MSKEWTDYQKHGEVVKDPYYAQKHRTTIVTPQHKTISVTPIRKTKVDAPIVTKNGWPGLWDSVGTIYSLQPLVFPAEPIYNERKFGLYRVRKDDDDYHINKFRPHVKLPYNFNNFRIYINENSYFMSNLPDAGVGWDEGPNLTNKDVRKVPFNTIPYTRMLSGAYFASYLSGVSMDHVQENSSVPKIIASIMRYNLYYTTRKLTVSKR
jgi:hypothetical protein